MKMGLLKWSLARIGSWKLNAGKSKERRDIGVGSKLFYTFSR
jgi:hypothetical protein